MSNSLKDYLHPSFVSPALISSENLARIVKITNYFSDECSKINFFQVASIWGFECSLNNPVATADFFFCTRSSNKFNYLEESNKNNLLTNIVWQNIANFYRDWSNSDTLIAKKVKDIWLEFDLESYNNNIPIPSIFFDASKINSQVELQWIIDNSLSQLLGKEIPRSQQDIFLQSIAALPNNIPIFQVGLLLSRIDQNLRIYTTSININQICHYLTKLNWQGDVDLLVGILNRVSGLIDKFQLQLEIANELCSTIGIEFYCYYRHNLQTLLNYLTATGFCLPAKRDALLAFPGSTDNFSRRIAYLKMTYTPNKPLQFKAYLGITPKIKI